MNDVAEDRKKDLYRGRAKHICSMSPGLEATVLDLCVKGCTLRVLMCEESSSRYVRMF